MQFAPTWDLFILVFFAIIIAYSFIIGRDSTLKIIIATYVAILATDGIGGLFEKLLLSQSPVIDIFSFSDVGSIIVLKILIFVVAIVLLTIRGKYVVAIGEERSALINIAITGTFGFLSAGLIVSTILVYVSGGTFVGMTAATSAGINLARTSYLAQIMTENYSFWFSMPAIAFVLASFVSGSDGGGGSVAEEHHH